MSTMQATPAPSPSPVAVSTPKRIAIVKKVETVGSVITFTFMNDAVRKFDFAQLSDDLRLKCALHGLEQKARDNFAGVAKDAAESNADPVALAVAYTDELIDQLFTQSRWTSERAKGEPRETPIDILAQAIVAVASAAGKTVPVESAKAVLDKMSKEDRRALSGKADIKAAVAQIRAANAAPTANADLSAFLG